MFQSENPNRPYRRKVLMKKTNNERHDSIMRQIAASKHCERVLRQDMPRHQVIPDKKKAGRKKACRDRRVDY